MSRIVSGVAGGIVVFQLIMIFGYLCFGGLATEYVIEFWGAVAKNVPYGTVDVPFWACVVTGLFVGGITIPVALITWLLALAGVVPFIL